MQALRSNSQKFKTSSIIEEYSLKDKLQLSQGRNAAQRWTNDFYGGDILLNDCYPMDEEEEDDDQLGLEGIDAEQLRQMINDPRYAALFTAHCKLFIIYLRQM